ncbi:MAG TPA: prepilin-type N-terminal cleavage/methylation domain-containing protein [Candidatus Saccharimonadia bacterium]|nr:prepilin-type N-terminal cleavage/methylation domain-containing protein [Candidatus Saccharimonadia bacterium]
MATLSHQRGVSLIELLVAVAILAALYGAITIAVDAAGGARRVEREGLRFAALVRIACERAQVSGRDYGIHVARGGYAFSIAGAQAWRLEAGGDLRPRELARGMTLALEREGTDAELVEELPAEPQAACFASGELTPFAATLSAGELAPFEIDAAIDGTVTTRPGEPPA